MTGASSFVYVLEWPDEEWSAVKRQTSAQHGNLVGAIEDRTLHRTDYSPAGRASP